MTKRDLFQEAIVSQFLIFMPDVNCIEVNAPGKFDRAASWTPRDYMCGDLLLRFFPERGVQTTYDMTVMVAARQRGHFVDLSDALIAVGVLPETVKGTTNLQTQAQLLSTHRSEVIRHLSR